MPKSKLMQLLIKHAAEPQPQTVMMPQPNTDHNSEIIELGYDLQELIKMMHYEMSAEIGLLKERGFDREMIGFFHQIIQRFEKIFKNLNPEEEKSIASSAREIIDFLNNRHNKAIIDNLDFLSKHHLKQTNVDFISGKILRHPEIRSFHLIPKLEELSNNILNKSNLTSVLPPTVK